MSYKDYSEKAAKEIIIKVRESQNEQQDSHYHMSFDVDHESSEDKEMSESASGQNLDYEYSHPTNAEYSRIFNNHIFIQKWFKSDLPEKMIWNVIQSMLDEAYAHNEKLGKVEEYPSRKKWIHLDHANHKMVVTLIKNGRLGSLKISKRVGFWSPPVEGILHGLYTALILFALTFVIFQPPLIFNIAIYTGLWALNAFVIYRFSISSRKKKLKQLTNFAADILASIEVRSKSMSSN